MRLALILTIVLLAVVLAVQNAEVVTLSAFAWRLEASLAVIIVLCIAVGAIIAALALAPQIFRRRAEEHRLRRQIAELDPPTAARDDAAAMSPSAPAPARPQSRT
jgi:uncharacterized integral membrane protein